MQGERGGVAHILEFLVDRLVELVPLRQVGAGAALDPLPKLLQEHLQASSQVQHTPL